MPSPASKSDEAMYEAEARAAAVPLIKWKPGKNQKGPSPFPLEDVEFERIQQALENLPTWAANNQQKPVWDFKVSLSHL